MAINEKRLDKQLNKAITTSKGFIHTDLNGKKYKISDNDVKIITNKYNKKREKHGGIIPLIPLFAGLSALGALSGSAAGIAKAVNDAKHNKKMEEIAEDKGITVVKGDGVFLNPYQGGALKDFIKNIVKQSNVEDISKKGLKDILKNLSDGVEIKAEGKGLFLNPYPYQITQTS